MGQQKQLNLRKSHPGMFRSLTWFGIVQVAAGVNLWFSSPTFNPHNISKYVIASVYFVLGVSLLFFLNLRRDLRKIRLIVAISIAWSFFWGIANTQQFLNGNASLQLPIWIIGMTIAQIPWLVESPVNPMTEQK